ncbi:discoidin domain-containing protein [Kitasatospora sp. NPDC049285]|uniref:discoidin domain-containing protein n=1 Tax=Kitasatospora sp. NPDC049285 TaxID=3157096 RepID=UPI00344AC359
MNHPTGERGRLGRAAVALAALVAALAVPATQAGAAGTETALGRTGWTATSNTPSSTGDAPAHAVDADTGSRFSSDTAMTAGMWLQLDLGSAQSFNQLTMDSGGYPGDYAHGYQVEVSGDGTNFTTVDTETAAANPVTATFPAQHARYVRIELTTGVSPNWWSIVDLNLYTDGTTGTDPGTGTPPPPTGGALGDNVIVFDPGMAQSAIQSRLDALANQQGANEFGAQRYALLFKPGTYGTAAAPLNFSLGFYETVAGLGRNPGDVVINGSVDVYNQCTGGDQSQCYATTNFWRSLSNLTVNVAGKSGCYNGADFWAVSQAAPLRRVRVNGKLTLMDYCTGSPAWASGGFIADSQETGGGITNGSQQQYFARNTSMDSWSNGVWNQVFCGSPGAPAQSFAANSGLSGGPNPYTTLATCPVTREAPYLYLDAAGAYQVFVPDTRTDSTGPTWLNGATPGTSLPLSSFYVVQPGTGADTVNAALNAGDNLLFAPGVHRFATALNVTRADTKILGLGMATLVPTNGNTVITTADVDGVDLTGLILDAGPVRSPYLLRVGTPGSHVSHAADPSTLHDVFVRVGGATVGSVDTAVVVNSDHTLIDDAWIWRADHGAGGGSWTSDQSDTGITVNGDHVVALGLAVEHFQKTEANWLGQDGKLVFFQNENPYEVPNQASWMASSTQKGYPALAVGPAVTSFQGWGLGSYSYFSQGVDIHNSTAFQAPNAPGVHLHDLLTVFLNGSGGIDSVVNGVGAPVSPTFGGPSDVVSYP